VIKKVKSSKETFVFLRPHIKSESAKNTAYFIMKIVSFLFLLCSATIMAEGGERERPAFLGEKPEAIGITCSDEADACPLGNDPSVERVNVCRTGYHPVTGEERSKSLCIKPDKGTALDECGCCGDVCPTRPSFENITCTDEVNAQLENPNVVVVCRDVFNPFTGLQEPKTVRTRMDKSLEGDECGCCEGVCPTQGEGKPLFERPATTNETCEADLVECDRRNTTGFFACRSISNPLTGVAEEKSVCLSEGKAWESDTCGCCGDDCPATRIDLACDQEEEEPPTCTFKNGAIGNYVCRSLFHPVNGELASRTFCADTENAWVFDTCGCCDDDCGVEPESGFLDEEEQWLALLEEDPSMLEDGDGGDDDSSSPTATTGSVLCLGSLLVGVMMALA
jgi:hypothetical protein